MKIFDRAVDHIFLFFSEFKFNGNFYIIISKCKETLNPIVPINGDSGTQVSTEEKGRGNIPHNQIFNRYR